jgi:Fe-S cluster biogenesis protein NfuA
MDQTTVMDALDNVRSLVQADGGDLELVGVDPSSRRVNLRLVLEGVSCHECVMPRPMLEDIAANMLRRSVPDLETVSIEDPREHADYESPDAH